MAAYSIKFLSVVIVLSVAVGVAAGQEARPLEPADERPPLLAADVYVNDSFAAAEALGKARRLASEGRWSAAAEALQQLADAEGDQLIRLAPGRFTGLQPHIHRLIADWPDDALLREYRLLFEPRVAERLAAVAAPPGIDELLSIFESFFVTEAAGELADRIAQLAVEAGDFALAEALYARVLDEHPDRGDYADRYRAMLSLLAAFEGRVDADSLGPEGKTVIRWMGQDRPLRQIVAELPENFAALFAPPDSSEWPIFGGDPGRNRRASTSVDELGLLWRFDGFGDAERTRRSPGGEDRSPTELSMFPVVVDDVVFAQRHREIVALRRGTGALLWRFRPDDAQAARGSLIDERAPGWDSVTVHNRRVYAVLPGEATPTYGYEATRTPSDLLCIDFDTGREIWRSDRRVLEEQFAEVAFDSSPVVTDDSVYLIGRRRRSFGFEDSFLYRFDAATGALVYRTHLGSASTGTFGNRRPTRAIAGLHGATIYVASNLGTIAAVTARTGGVEWLQLYERALNTAGFFARSTRRINPWEFNPVVIEGETVISLPTDSAHVFVVDATDVDLLQAIPTEDIGRATSILGAKDEVLCTVGDEIACFDLHKNELKWPVSLPEGAEIEGRGVWADDRLLVPTNRGIEIFRVDNGEHSYLPWDAEGAGGNLVALPDQILVAGVDRISAYVNRSEIWARLRARMAEAPSDPIPALELAEVALANAELNEAMSALDEAVRRAEEFPQPPDSTAHRRVFQVTMNMFDWLLGRSRLDEERIEKLFAYAAQFAPDPKAHVAYRMAFAEVFAERDAARRAIELYQQILRDRTLRAMRIEVAADDEHPRATAEFAGALAEARTAALIAEHGRKVYASFDEEAKQALETANAADDEAALHRLIASYPNSLSAAAALTKLGGLYAQRRQPMAAARYFARAYHHYPDQVDRPSLLRRIADAYEIAGKPEHAYRWLTKAAREHPGVRFEHEGYTYTFAKYRERLADVRERVEPSRPRIELPLAGPQEVTIDGPITFLSPQYGEEPGSSWSRYFVSTPEGIRAFDAASSAELWPAPAEVRGRVRLLMAMEQLAVFVTPYQVFAIDVSTGQRRWSHGRVPHGIDAVHADWEDVDAIRDAAVRGRRVVSLRDSGEMTALDLATGAVLWSGRPRPRASGGLRLFDDWVVYESMPEGRLTVAVLDAGTGEPIGSFATADNRAIFENFVTLDGRVVVVTAASIASYEVGEAVGIDSPTAKAMGHADVANAIGRADAGEEGDDPGAGEGMGQVGDSTPAPLKRWATPDGRGRWRVSVSGHVRRGSLLMDVDAVYFSSDGRRVHKIGLEDGALMWESEPLVTGRDDDITTALIDGKIIVSSSSSVAAIDAVNGLTLWRGTTPARPRFAARLLTAGYVAAVDVPGGLREDDEAVVYFYDHRVGGVIPSDGGALKLGPLEDIRAMSALDGALLIQTGSTIRTWTGR